jgi:hypothetical protein
LAWCPIKTRPQTPRNRPLLYRARDRYCPILSYPVGISASRLSPTPTHARIQTHHRCTASAADTQPAPRTDEIASSSDRQSVVDSNSQTSPNSFRGCTKAPGILPPRSSAQPILSCTHGLGLVLGCSVIAGFSARTGPLFLHVSQGHRYLGRHLAHSLVCWPHCLLPSRRAGTSPDCVCDRQQHSIATLCSFDWRRTIIDLGRPLWLVELETTRF